jgi:hypothetical protein
MSIIISIRDQKWAIPTVHSTYLQGLLELKQPHLKLGNDTHINAVGLSFVKGFYQRQENIPNLRNNVGKIIIQNSLKERLSTSAWKFLERFVIRKHKRAIQDRFAIINDYSDRGKKMWNFWSQNYNKYYIYRFVVNTYLIINTLDKLGIEPLLDLMAYFMRQKIEAKYGYYWVSTEQPQGLIPCYYKYFETPEFNYFTQTYPPENPFQLREELKQGKENKEINQKRQRILNIMLGKINAQPGEIQAAKNIWERELFRRRVTWTRFVSNYKDLQVDIDPFIEKIDLSGIIYYNFSHMLGMGVD